MAGWVCLHRKILESRVFLNEGLFKVWVWCLLKANHEENWVEIKTGKGVSEAKVNPGQFIFGRKTAARKLKMKPDTVYSRMKKLEKLGNINMQNNTHYSLVTITNWDTYQSKDNDVQHPHQHPNNTQTPANQHPNNTDNNDNNEKNVNNKNTGEIFSFPENWPERIIEKFNEYIQHRKEIKKKMTPTAFKKQINFIEKESGGDLDIAIEIIDQSIRNSWTGLFPVNKKQNLNAAEKRLQSNIKAGEDFVNGLK